MRQVFRHADGAQNVRPGVWGMGFRVISIVDPRTLFNDSGPYTLPQFLQKRCGGLLFHVRVFRLGLLVGPIEF